MIKKIDLTPLGELTSKLEELEDKEIKIKSLKSIAENLKESLKDVEEGATILVCRGGYNSNSSSLFGYLGPIERIYIRSTIHEIFDPELYLSEVYLISRDRVAHSIYSDSHSFYPEDKLLTNYDDILPVLEEANLSDNVSLELNDILNILFEHQ